MFVEEDGMKLNIIYNPIVPPKNSKTLINNQSSLKNKFTFTFSNANVQPKQITKNENKITKNKAVTNKKAKLGVKKDISLPIEVALRNSSDIKEETDDYLKTFSKTKSIKNKEILKRKMTRSSNNELDLHVPYKKKFKHNSLFFDKRDIPKVDQSEVTVYKEDIFSNETFNNIQLHPFMVSNLEKLGFTKMTSVQSKVIPHILNGKDVLVKSQTGSGKTFSYAVPIIHLLQSIKPNIGRSDGTKCIIIVPTRELALQTLSVITSLVRPFVWVVPGCIIGGEKRKSEKARIKKGINIMVATPGRLVDHIDSTSCLDLATVQYLVIDEADRMLEMGFERDIARIVNTLKEKCAKSKQTMLLSATLTPGVEKLAGMSLQQPIKIDMTLNTNTETGEISIFSTPTNLKHFFSIVPMKMRLVTLATFIISKCHFSKNPCKILCFMGTQDSVEFHHSLLEVCFNLTADEEDSHEGDEDARVQMLKLYGNMQQQDRTKIYNEFHKAKSGVLFCTDVAARGLDLAHVDWIVQFTCAESAVDYIHRVGRSARIGAKGNGLIFLAPSEADYLHILNEHNILFEELKLELILDSLVKFNYQRKLDLTHKGVTPHSWQEAASFLQNQFAEKLQNDVNLRTLARKAYHSFLKSYTTYPAALKKIFFLKNLHLGHVATSFALSESPGSVSKIASRFFKGKTTNRNGKMFDRKSTALNHNIKKTNSNFSWVGEFENGL